MRAHPRDYLRIRNEVNINSQSAFEFFFCLLFLKKAQRMSLVGKKEVGIAVGAVITSRSRTEDANFPEPILLEYGSRFFRKCR